MSNYDDIINVQYPIPSRHKKMSMRDRAAQFAPFAALTGYNEAIKETARLTDKKILLTQEEKLKISNKLNYIISLKDVTKEYKITYFIKDEKKSGGKYVTELVKIKRIDEVQRIIITIDNKNISIEDVLKIESEVFLED